MFNGNRKYVLLFVGTIALAVLGCSGGSGTITTGVSGRTRQIAIGGAPPPDGVANPIVSDLPGTEVLIRDSTNARTITTVRSGADARFRISLSPGRYWLVATPASSAHSPTPIEVVLETGPVAVVEANVDQILPLP